MKKFTTLLLLFISMKVIGQLGSYSTLNSNNLKMWSDNTCSIIEPSFSKASGGFITNPNTDNQKYLSTIFKSSINVLGYTKNNFITGITSHYGQNSEYAVSGPITDDIFNQSYNKVWQVFDWEIRNLIDDYNDNQIIDDLPATNLLEWPGKSNPHSQELQGISWTGRDFAPFYDNNNDGIYDPYDGDYPILDKSCPLKIPGQMIYSIYHGYLDTTLEISKLIYSFSSKNNEILNNTVFVRLSVLSKYENLTKVKLGIFNDFDLGCPNDDYLGTSLQNKTIYTYNQSDVDTNICQAGSSSINAYGKNPPIQSITCLDNTPINSMICYRISSNAALTDPYNFNEVYNILSSKWKDGTPLTYGGGGYDPISNNYINGAFTSSPTDPSGWSMKTSESPGVDPRMFISIDVGDLEIDSIVIANFAYTFHPADLSTDHFSRVDSMLNNIEKVQSIFDACFDSSFNSDVCITDCVWPGDTDVNGIVNNLDLLNVGVAMNSFGIQRQKISESWRAHSGDNWTSQTPENINFKHIDCNGSGSINKTDKEVIETNFLYKNPTYEKWGGYNEIGDELTIEFKKEEYTLNELIKAELSIQSDNVYGFGVTIEYDPTLFYNSYNYLNEFWKTNSDNPIRVIRTEPGKVHFAVAKTEGNGEDLVKQFFGAINLKVLDGITNSFETNIKYSNYEKIDANGKVSPLTATQKTITVSNTLSTEVQTKGKIKIYPNPANNLIHIESNELMTDLILIDNMGQNHVLKIDNNSGHLANVLPGFYILRAKDIKGKVYSEKLIVFK